MAIRILIMMILIISSLGTLFLFIYSLLKLKSSSKYPFAFFLLSVFIYTFGYAMEVSQDSIEGISLALKFEYLGIPYVAAFWLLFSVNYSGIYKKNNYFLAALFIIPVITTVMFFTNNYHHLHYREFVINNTGLFPMAVTAKGPWYIVDIIYKNILIYCGSILFFRMILRSSGYRKKQAIIIFTGSLIPGIGSILSLSGINLFNIDTIPIYLAFSVPVFGYAMFRLRMFDIAPIAHTNIFQNMKDPVMILDMSRNIVDFNIAAEKMFPELNNDILGINVHDVLKGYQDIIENFTDTKVDRGEIEYLNDGEKRVFSVTLTELVSSFKNKVGLIVMLHDVTEHKQIEKKLHDLATVDELTKLFNRRFFTELSLKELKHNYRYKRIVSMLLLDLDYFKKINDSFGHAGGDLVLVDIAAVMKKELRDCDIPGRHGGEEFTIFLPETDLSGAKCMAERLRQEISLNESLYNGSEIMITCSIGISTLDFSSADSNIDPDELLNTLLFRSDKALYKAKKNGRNRVEVYSAED